MDRQKLVDRLRAVRPQIAPAEGLLPHTPGFRRGYTFELQREIAQLIDLEPCLPVMRPFGGVHLSINGTQLASPVLDILGETGADAAVEWLEKVSTTDVANVRLVAEVRGLSVSGVVELPNGIHISHASQAPRSTRIAELDPPMTPAAFLRSSLEPPTSVAWLDICDVDWRNEKAGDKAHSNAWKALHQTILSMTLIPQQAPLIAQTWAEFVDPDLERALSGRGWRVAVEDGAPLDQPVQPVRQADLVQVAEFLSLPSAITERLTLPLSSLSLSRRRRQIGNQAIEICTALEAIFGDDDQKTELSYRLRLRAALFLGRTLEERQSIRKQISGLYDLRSKAVHGAKSKKALSHTDALKLVLAGEVIVVWSVERISSEGRWPDWGRLEIDPPPLLPTEIGVAGGDAEQGGSSALV